MRLETVVALLHFTYTLDLIYYRSIKKGSASINPIMGGVILQFVAALLGTLLLGSMIANGKASEIHYDKKGLLWSMGAGLWVG